jgi:hypothetical protein
MATVKVNERNCQVTRDFIELCKERNAVSKYLEFDSLADQQYDTSVLTAICEYQLSLPFPKFMATGFEGPAA